MHADLTSKVRLILPSPAESTVVIEVPFHPHHVLPSLVRIPDVGLEMIKEFFERHLDRHARSI